MLYYRVILFLIFCGLPFCSAGVAHAANGIPELPLVFGQYITNWLTAGPLPNRTWQADDSSAILRMGLDTDYLKPFGGETSAVIKAGMVVPGFPVISFTALVSQTPEIDFNSLYNLPDQKCAYAVSSIVLAEPQTVFLHAGSDDGIRIWIDGALVIDKYLERGFVADEDWVKLSLSKGRHLILVKSEDNLGAWMFSLRFLDRLQHRQILASRVSETLDIKLFCPTGEFEQVYLTFSPLPAATNFAVQINGMWLNDNLSQTQTFSVAPGEPVQIPEKLSALPLCQVEASASGIPGRQPRAVMSVYLTPTDSLYTNRLNRIAAILHDLSVTSSTARIAGRHRGLLSYYLHSLAAFTNSSQCSESVEAHKLLTTLDLILNELSQGNDYLGSFNGEYLNAYHSKLDGSGQPFYISIPTNYFSDIPLPLVIFLHDAGVPFSVDFKNSYSASPYIAVRLHGRGQNCAYLGWAASAVLELIDYMTNYYRIDPNRISLIGSSMGGYGVWTLSSTYPGRFASVSALNSFSANTPLANLQNLPVQIMHGDADLIIPVSFSRAALAYLSSRTCPVVYNELPRAGYYLQTAADIEKPIEWMLNYRKESAPADVLLEQMYSWNDSAYWLSDVVPLSPRNTAELRGRFSSKNELLLYCNNIRSARITLPEKHVENSSLLSITVNGVQLRVSAPLPNHIFLTGGSNGFAVARSQRTPPTSGRPYRKGSWQNMFNGEPVMVVKGSSGSKKLSGAIDRCAGSLSKWSFTGRIMDTGGHPVTSDKELSESDQENYNLILLGGMRENRIVDDIAKNLAVPLKKDSLVIGDETVSLTGRGCWIVQKNPAFPNRLVWIWASSDPAFFSATAPWIMDWQFPAEDPPDILMYDLSTKRYERAIHLTDGWNIESDDLTSPVLTNCIAAPEDMLQLFADTLSKATGCDAVWIPDSVSKELQSLTHVRATEASRLIFKHSMAMVCSIPGDVLNELSRVASKKRTLPSGSLYPAPGIVTDDSQLRVAVLPRSLKSLATACRFSLTDVRYIKAPLHDIFTRSINRKAAQESIRESK